MSSVWETLSDIQKGKLDSSVSEPSSLASFIPGF